MFGCKSIFGHKRSEGTITVTEKIPMLFNKDRTVAATYDTHYCVKCGKEMW